MTGFQCRLFHVRLVLYRLVCLHALRFRGLDRGEGVVDASVEVGPMLFLPAAFRRRSLPQWTVGVLHAPHGPVDGHVA